MSVHTEDRPHECGIPKCESAFKTSKELAAHAASHAKLHTEDRPHQCDVPKCDTSFKTSERSAAHASFHAKYPVGQSRALSSSLNGLAQTRKAIEMHSVVGDWALTIEAGCRFDLTGCCSYHQKIVHFDSCFDPTRPIESGRGQAEVVARGGKSRRKVKHKSRHTRRKVTVTASSEKGTDLKGKEIFVTLVMSDIKVTFGCSFSANRFS